MILDKNVLAQMKAAGLQKPDMVSDMEWENCDSQIEDSLPIVEVPAVQQAVVPVVPMQQAVVPSQQANYIAKPLSMSDTLQSSSMVVDATLKLKSGVVKIGDSAVRTPIVAKVLFSESKVKQTITVENSKKEIEYYHTYDGRVESRTGRLFQDCVNHCTSINPKAYAFTAFDIVMEITEDVLDEDGRVAVKAGTRIGHSTSSTTATKFKQFLNQCKQAGVDVNNGEAGVKIKTELRTNNNRQDFRVFVFEMI